ncbi:hypothetical protein AB0J49_28595, partial [Streptomyces sp. NPDC049906]
VRTGTGVQVEPVRVAGAERREVTRIGDVVAAARDDVLIVASEREPKESLLIGNHGSLTPAEQLVPLLEVRS